MLFTFSIDKNFNSIIIRIIVDHIAAAHLAYPVFMSIFFCFQWILIIFIIILVFVHFRTTTHIFVDFFLMI